MEKKKIGGQKGKLSRPTMTDEPNWKKKCCCFLHGKSSANEKLPQLNHWKATRLQTLNSSNGLSQLPLPLFKKKFFLFSLGTCSWLAMIADPQLLSFTDPN